MPSVYSAAFRTPGAIVASAIPIFEIIATATDRPLVKEVGISGTQSSTSQFGLGIPAVAGINPIYVDKLFPEDPDSPPSTVKIATRWAIAPTVPANYFRRGNMRNAAGAEVIWKFKKGLMIPVSGSLVMWGISDISPFDCWVVIDV